MAYEGAADVAAMFARVAQELMSRQGFQDTLDGIVGSAVAVISGCTYAGIMTVRNGEVVSPAVTDPVVAACDAEQRRLDEGPCLSALAEHEPVLLVDDVENDPRWPRFGPAAAKLGIHSMLSCELATGRRSTAALNLYSDELGAFDDHAAQLGLIFAQHASMALAQAELQAQLRSAVESRAGIGQAIGILMERHRIRPEQAFEMLKVASQNLNIRLRELAEEVVRTGVDPQDVRRR